jgi:hypothetical protein
MTAPHKGSCPHVRDVIVTDGSHQVVYEGQTFHAGDIVPNVDHATADYWLVSGWATSAAVKKK